MRASYEFARVHFTRFRPVRGYAQAHDFPGLLPTALRLNGLHFRNQRSWRSTQRRGDKRSAEADLIASHAPLRGGSHKARQNGPKHYPGDPTGAAAPLVCLSSISFFKQRKISPPEGVGIVER